MTKLRMAVLFGALLSISFILSSCALTDQGGENDKRGENEKGNVVLTADGVSLTTDEDTPLSAQLSGSSSVEGFTLNFVIGTQPTLGTVTISQSGQVTYAPNPDVSGTDYFSFRVTSQGNSSAEARVEIIIRPVVDIPRALAKSYETNEDQSLSENIPIRNPDHLPVTFGVKTQPSNGHVAFTNASLGTFVYTPNLDYNGNDSFEYEIEDSDGNGSSQTISIVVAPVPDQPLVTDSLTFTATEDTPYDGSISASNPDHSVLNFAAGSGPYHGSFTAWDSSLGLYTYSPAPNYCGGDSFTFQLQVPSNTAFNSAYKTVTIWVTCVNDDGIALAGTMSTSEDTRLDSTLPRSNGDNLALNFSIDSGPSHGTATITSSSAGTFQYMPATDYNGTDSFVFKVVDARGHESQATIDLNVTSVNDLPTVDPISLSGTEDTVVTGNLSAHDKDGTIVSFTITPVSGGGTFTITDQATGAFSYQPAANYNGQVVASYTARDNNGGVSGLGTINIFLAAVTDTPTLTNPIHFTLSPQLTYDHTQFYSVTLNFSGALQNPDQVADMTLVVDVPPQQGTGTLVNGYINYKANLNATSSDSLTVHYQSASDTSYKTNNSTVNITYQFPPHITSSQSFTLNEDTSVTHTFTVMDPEGNSIQLCGSTAPSHGTISNPSLTGNQIQVTYSPATNYSGSDTYYLCVRDPNSASQSERISLTINEVNDPPVVSHSPVTVAEDSVSNIFVSVTDVENHAITGYAITALPQHGIVTQPNGTANNRFDYVPNIDYNGPDSFSVTATDSLGAVSQPAVISITVTPVQDGPKLVSRTFEIPEDSILNDQVPITDPDGEPLTLTVTRYPTHGYLNLNRTTGVFSYEPYRDYSGSDYFVFSAADPGNRSQTGITYTINTTPVDDPPNAPATFSFSCTEDPSSCSWIFDAYDPDSPSTTLQYEWLQNPTHGTVTLAPRTPRGFILSYSPNANFNGTDQATVRLTDQSGNFVDTSIEPTITPVNDFPQYGGPSSVTTDEDTPVDFTIQFTDVDGDTLQYSYGYCGASSANFSMAWADEANHIMRITPAKDKNGTFSFCITASDGIVPVSRTISLIINPVADPPTLGSLSIVSSAGLGKKIDLDVQAGDSDNPVTSVDVVTPPQNGSLSIEKIHISQKDVFRLTYLAPDSLSDPVTDSAVLVAVSSPTVKSPEVTVPIRLFHKDEPSVLSFALGVDTFCMLSSNKKIDCWGYASEIRVGLLGWFYLIPDGPDPRFYNLITIDLGAGNEAEALYGKFGNYCAKVLGVNELRCWGPLFGSGDYHQAGQAPHTISLSSAGQLVAFDVGPSNACALLNDGSVRCFGDNSHGQLGLGHTQKVSAPATFTSLSPVLLGTSFSATKIAVGEMHACAIAQNGQLKCWGSGAYGRTGLEESINRGITASQMGDNLPFVNLGTGQTASSVSAGYYYTCVILQSGQLKCFGDNISGQLGLEHNSDVGYAAGHMGDNLAAVNLGTGRSAVSVSCGYTHTCAILDDQSVKCWGATYSDRTDGKTPGYDVGTMGDNLNPLVFPGNEGMATLFGGTHNNCALSVSGAPNCWNSNSYGGTWRPGPSGYLAPSDNALVFPMAGVRFSSMRVDGPALVNLSDTPQYRAYATIDGTEMDVTESASWHLMDNDDSTRSFISPGKFKVNGYQIKSVTAIFEGRARSLKIVVNDPRTVDSLYLSPVPDLVAGSGAWFNPVARMSDGGSKPCYNDLTPYSLTFQGVPYSESGGYFVFLKEGTLQVTVHCFGLTADFSLPVANPNSGLTGKQVLFVTARLSPAFTSLDVADTACQAEAANWYGLPYKTWKALLGSSGVALGNRVSLQPSPIYGPNQDFLFSNSGTSWPSVLGSIPSSHIPTSSNQRYHGYVWTGLETNGSASSLTCNGWTTDTDPNASGTVGIADDTSSGGKWLNSGAIGCQPNTAAIYCFGQ